MDRMESREGHQLEVSSAGLNLREVEQLSGLYAVERNNYENDTQLKQPQGPLDAPNEEAKVAGGGDDHIEQDSNIDPDVGSHPTSDRKELFVSPGPSGLSGLPKPRANGKVALLSIDGGGIRDAIPARLLARLEASLQKKSNNPDARIADFFDMFAGTSAGGILALMLTLPNKDGRPAITAQQACDFWMQNVKRIFKLKTWPRWMATIRNIWRPKYTVSDFEKLLFDFFNEKARGGGAVSLSEALRPVLVTSYDIENTRPYFFMSERAAQSERHNFRAVDVCRATSAAPTIFKPALVRSRDRSQKMVCIDGGIIANNPTMAGLLHIFSDQKMFPPSQREGEGLNRRSLRDVLVLSLGAGEYVTPLPYDKIKKKGLLGWAEPMVDVLVWGGGNMVHCLLCLLCNAESCKDNYIRIEIESLPEISTRMDNTSGKNMKELEKLADESLTMHMTMIDSLAGETSVEEATNAERLDRLADELVREYNIRSEEQGLLRS